jgi:hypothetical protein
MVYYQPPDQNWMTPIRSPVHDPSPIHGRSNGPPSFFPPSHRARQHTNLPWWRPWTDPPILGPSAWIPDPTDAKRREDVCEPEGGAYHRRRAEREASYSTRRLQGPFPPAEATTSIYLYWRSWFTPPRAPGYSVGMGIIGGCYSLSLSVCVSLRWDNRASHGDQQMAVHGCFGSMGFGLHYILLENLKPNPNNLR